MRITVCQNKISLNKQGHSHFKIAHIIIFIYPLLINKDGPTVFFFFLAPLRGHMTRIYPLLNPFFKEKNVSIYRWLLSKERKNNVLSSQKKRFLRALLITLRNVLTSKTNLLL